MNSQRGVSFMEILISLFLFSIFLLGFDAMQLVSLRETKSAFYFAEASNQLHNMTERLYLLKGHYTDQEIILWNEQNKKILPQGRGIIRNQLSQSILTIFWGNMKENVCEKNKIGQSGCLSIVLTI